MLLFLFKQYLKAENKYGFLTSIGGMDTNHQ